MKFAFIIFKYFPYGGMQRDMLRTANELVKRGHAVEIFSMTWQGDLPSHIKMHELPQKAWFNYQRYQQFIEATFAIIKGNGFDYIFGYNRMAGLDAHFAADPCFIERAHKQRSFLYRLLPRYKWFSACEKAVFSADVNTQILAVSLTEKPHFQHWYGTQSERFHYVPPFLSPERFASCDKVLQVKAAMRAHLRNAFGFVANDFVFLLTGSGFAMKGLDRAILALAALPGDVRTNTKLVAVGQDNPKQFQKMAKKLGLAKQVVISKGRPDIPQLMQGADVCIHPAYRENTGLVILEGMACGAPMLVTASCGYAHHVADADAGIVSAYPFNQTEFNQQFLQMIQADKKTEWAKNGLSYVQQIMQANDGGTEAEILIKLANQKTSKRVAA